MTKRADIIKRLEAELDQERFQHSLRAERVALGLARKYGISAIQASQAALLHDCARKYSRPGLLKQARRFKLKLDPVSIAEPKLLHAELGALLAKKIYGIKSQAVLDAIRRHTVGKPKMTRLEKIIYLADHIEEGRDFSGVNKVRRLAFKDLDKAIVEAATSMIEFLLAQDLPVHSGTIETRNYYLLKK